MFPDRTVTYKDSPTWYEYKDVPFVIRTSVYTHEPIPWWKRCIRVFRPGWYGSIPYLKWGNVVTDNIGRTHIDLKVNLSDECQQSVEGTVIAKVHLPSDKVLLDKEEYEKLLTKASE